MTARSFTVTLDDSDRLAVLTALGFAEHITPFRMRRPISELIERLSRIDGHDAPAAPSGTETARAILSSPPQTDLVPKDFFAADRKRNIPLSAPPGAELQTIPIVSAQEKPDKNGHHLQVIFGQGRGQANCFDPQLWPYIKKAQGHEAQLWIVESGKYLNIVGVRA